MRNLCHHPKCSTLPILSNHPPTPHHLYGPRQEAVCACVCVCVCVCACVCACVCVLYHPDVILKLNRPKHPTRSLKKAAINTNILSL